MTSFNPYPYRPFMADPRVTYWKDRAEKAEVERDDLQALVNDLAAAIDGDDEWRPETIARLEAAATKETD